MTSYHNEAGTLEDSFVDEGRRHFVIALKRAMGRGETLTFGVWRTAMVGFTKDEEWLERTIDHPGSRWSRRIIFPKERPCRSATLQYGDVKVTLPIVKMVGGRTFVELEMVPALAVTPYVVRWFW